VGTSCPHIPQPIQALEPAPRSDPKLNDQGLRTKDAPQAQDHGPRAAAKIMHLVLCADRQALPGLHVAMFSVLDHIGTRPHFHLFSHDLTEADRAALASTLTATDKPFDLTHHPIDPADFRGFPPLQGSHATYFRLHALSAIDADTLLYLDADTLCDIDVAALAGFDFHDHPAALTPEAPLHLAADRDVARQLGNPTGPPYFNAGVILVNTAEWRKQNVSGRAIEYLASHSPAYHDQSALNIVLHRNAAHLDPVYNTIANHRSHWPAIRRPYGQNHRLIHFLDVPKPWHPAARFLHPQFPLWQSVLKKTAFGNLDAWHRSRPKPAPLTPAALRKALKDKLLFTAYRYHLPIPIKGLS